MSDFTREERDTLAARTRALASSPSGAAALGASLDVLLLHVAGSRFGIDARAVSAVAELTRLTPIPHAPPYVAGLMAYMGEVLVVFYLRRALGLETTALPEFGRVVILGHGADRLVFVADAVEGPWSVPTAEFLPPPLTIANSSNGLIAGVDRTGLALLDAAALLRSDLLYVDIRLP